MKQFIVEHIFAPTPEISLSGRAYNYLIRVRRHRNGDCIELAFPNGEKLAYTIVEIDSTKKVILLSKATDAENVKGDKQVGASQSEKAKTEKTESFSPFTPIVLLQWMLKTAKMNTVIRQATEVGVRYILPVFGEFSVVQKQHDGASLRYERIIKEARQQSDSPVPTEVLPACSLNDAIKTLAKIIPRDKGELSPRIVKLYCTEKNVNTDSLLPIFKKPADAVILAIGCEGGISSNEYALLEQNDFKPCHFQTNILRAETASLYALAAVQTMQNELNQIQNSPLASGLI